MRCLHKRVAAPVAAVRGAPWASGAAKLDACKLPAAAAAPSIAPSASVPELVLELVELELGVDVDDTHAKHAPPAYGNEASSGQTTPSPPKTSRSRSTSATTPTGGRGNGARS